MEFQGESDCFVITRWLSLENHTLISIPIRFNGMMESSGLSKKTQLCRLIRKPHQSK